ncbi:hypothetical protein FT643_15955 [Ketobacter sp. MCCC 1A13808]|uniref:hypothetical protein n=1 Tax=Ketobacter sp. MCCC 1A13808 TaxID=2602738 RepID=UPI000F224862|nr:hypothetical protein [Ketobacter sp. MCCC 1A13808]MVF13637.1 hypothetical protein [Ketobacter sp. MCCC 1A13808]RLP53136.1 MAG: hypothetical protein D6160_17335 [Ketobacter sp.]
MTKLIGYALIAMGAAVLLFGINQLGVYLNDPAQFPIYHYLTNMPVAERTMVIQGSNMILPVGIFKISGLLSIILAGFLLLSLVRLLVSTGVRMITANIRDLAKQLVVEIQKINHSAER